MAILLGETPVLPVQVHPGTGRITRAISS